MISFVRGNLVEKEPTRVVLDVGGVGYEVSIPLSSYDPLPSRGQVCSLLTHDYVREDSHQLFGFATEDERRMFILLMSVTGIGPRLALSALSGLSVRDLKRAVVQGDVKRLSSISGIGKKTAERIVVELRDKISATEAIEAEAGAGDKPEEIARMRDAVLALIALGHKQDAARKLVCSALRGEGPDATVEELIKKSLGGMNRPG